MTGRVLHPMALAEMQRRWSALRGIMAAQGLDAVVVRQSDDWLGGHVKWLTDTPATNGYGTTVIFHRDAPMTVVQVGPFGGRRDARDDPDLPGTGDVLFTAPFASVGYTAGYEAGVVTAALRDHAARAVGVILPGYMPSALMQALAAAFPAALLDVTDAVDAVKAVKSPAEQARIADTAAMQDELFALALRLVRPGLRDADLAAALQHEGLRMGSEQGIFNLGSAPLGTPAVFRRRHFQGRVMQAGDHLTLLIENNGPGGYYTELARTIVLGKATADLVQGTAIAVAAQAGVQALLRPGVMAQDVFAAHNRCLAGHGLPPETRLFAHGQGYDLVERPLLRDDEPMQIAAGMCLALHPGFRFGGAYINMCDTFLVAGDGCHRLHRTAQQVFEV